MYSLENSNGECCMYLNPEKVLQFHKEFCEANMKIQDIVDPTPVDIYKDGSVYFCPNYLNHVYRGFDIEDIRRSLGMNGHYKTRFVYLPLEFITDKENCDVWVCDYMPRRFSNVMTTWGDFIRKGWASFRESIKADAGYGDTGIPNDYEEHLNHDLYCN